MNGPAQTNTLNRNAIGLAEVLFQSVTAMAPAGAVAFSLGAEVPFAGTALPLATLIALVVCLLIAINIAAMAKYLPSAGGYVRQPGVGRDGRMDDWVVVQSLLCAGLSARFSGAGASGR
jgi:amino acid transporter